MNFGKFYQLLESSQLLNYEDETKQLEAKLVKICYEFRNKLKYVWVNANVEENAWKKQDIVVYAAFKERFELGKVDSQKIFSGVKWDIKSKLTTGLNAVLNSISIESVELETYEEFLEVWCRIKTPKRIDSPEDVEEFFEKLTSVEGKRDQIRAVVTAVLVETGVLRVD